MSIQPRRTWRHAAAAAALALFCAAPTAAPTPRLEAKAAGNDCAACHGPAAVLPARHKATLNMKLADCNECHERKTPDTLVGKMSGSHQHLLSGVTCADCHGQTGKPEPVEMEQCLSCHGSGDKVAKLTAKVKPQNPHVSAHYGTELDCNLCHQQHRKSEDYCAECHDYHFQVP
jgi:hypothetical protein